MRSGLQMGPGGADDVEGAGDQDRVVVLGRTDRAIAGLLDGVALDHLVATECSGAAATFGRRHAAR